MIEVADPDLIYSKRKAITALFPYAVRRERDGQSELFGMFLRIAAASRRWGFMWRRVRPLVTTLLEEENTVSQKRAAILASPHFPWDNFTNGQRLVQLWAAAVSAFPYGDEIGQSVVDALLHIASQDHLRPYIPVRMWSWLDKRRSLPLVCWGRFRGTQQGVVQTVRALGNVEILKSYMLLVWSERDRAGFPALDEMCTSIQEDFGGIGMGCHREELLRHLDRVLSQLDLGLGHLRQHEPNLNGGDIEEMKYEYGELRNVLLEADREVVIALTRELPRLIALFSLLTLTDMYRVSLDVCVCDSSPVPVVACLGHSILLPPPIYPPISWIRHVALS